MSDKKATITNIGTYNAATDSVDGFSFEYGEERGSGLVHKWINGKAVLVTAFGWLPSELRRLAIIEQIADAPIDIIFVKRNLKVETSLESIRERLEKATSLIVAEIDRCSQDDIKSDYDISGYTNCAACNGNGCDRCMPHMYLPDDE